jgi:hypothetical protein
MIDRSIDRSIDWLIDWLIGRSYAMIETSSNRPRPHVTPFLLNRASAQLDTTHMRIYVLHTVEISGWHTASHLLGDEMQKNVIYLFPGLFNSIYYIASNDRMLWMINWEGCERKQLWTVLRYCCYYCLKGLNRASFGISSLQAKIWSWALHSME